MDYANRGELVPCCFVMHLLDLAFLDRQCRCIEDQVQLRSAYTAMKFWSSRKVNLSQMDFAIHWPDAGPSESHYSLENEVQSASTTIFAEQVLILVLTVFRCNAEYVTQWAFRLGAYWSSFLRCFVAMLASDDVLPDQSNHWNEDTTFSMPSKPVKCVTGTSRSWHLRDWFLEHSLNVPCLDCWCRSIPDWVWWVSSRNDYKRDIDFTLLLCLIVVPQLGTAFQGIE